MDGKFHERLREAMGVRGIRQVDLVEQTGIAKSAISAYVNGDYVPKQINTYKIAKVLGVNEAWLMGKDVPMDPMPTNILSIKAKKVPLLGEIACGQPTYVAEEKGSYVLTNNDDIDFCLRVEGDSMIDAGIKAGDLVFVRSQPCVDNGEIAVVLVGDEATLKRFYKTDDGVILKPENPSYQPIFYKADDFERVMILGKAVMVQSRL